MSAINKNLRIMVVLTSLLMKGVSYFHQGKQYCRENSIRFKTQIANRNQDDSLTYTNRDYSQWKTWNFNGGKVKNIVKFFDAEIPKDESHDDLFSSEEAKEAFYHGKVSLKVHGECACLVSSDHISSLSNNSPTDANEWVFYQRYDSGSKLYPISDNMVLPVDCIRLFDTNQLQSDQYTSAHKPHFYLWRKLDPESKQVKQTMNGVRSAIEKGLFPTPEKWGKPYMTCEWIGKRHQGNKYGLDYDHAIHPHGATAVELPSTARTLDQMCKYAVTQQIEGFMFQHPTSLKLYKLKWSTLVKDNAFSQAKVANIMPLYF